MTFVELFVFGAMGMNMDQPCGSYVTAANICIYIKIQPECA